VIVEERRLVVHESGALMECLVPIPNSGALPFSLCELTFILSAAALLGGSRRHPASLARRNHTDQGHKTWQIGAADAEDGGVRTAATR
jgi:hypothetical protein